MHSGCFVSTGGLVSLGNDGQLERMCAVLGAPELAINLKFVRNDDRVNGKEIMPIFADLFLKDTAAHWLEKLEEAGIRKRGAEALQIVCAQSWEHRY